MITFVLNNLTLKDYLDYQFKYELMTVSVIVFLNQQNLLRFILSIYYNCMLPRI